MKYNKKNEGKKENPLKDSNPFEHVYNLYNEDAGSTKDFKAFHKKFKDKTFYESYKTLANMALLIAVLVGCLCIFLACTYFADLISKAVPNMQLSIGIAVALLLLLEYGLKARIIPMCTRAALDRKKSFVFLLPVTLAIIGASIFTSYSGSQKLFYVVGEQTSDVRSEKDNLIADLRAQQKSILADREAYQKRNPKKSSSWLGADEMKALGKQIEAIQADKKTEVSELTETKEANTGHLIYLCLICELLILICYGFREYFEWKSYRECLVLNPELAAKNTIEVTHLANQFAANEQYQIAAENEQITPSASAKNTIGFKANKRPSNECNSCNVTVTTQKPVTPVTRAITSDNEDVTAKLSDRYSCTGNTLTYAQVAARLRTYRGHKEKGQRKPETVEKRIAYYLVMLGEMEANSANRVEEIDYATFQNPAS